jgi:hypothetical protein
MVTKQISLFLLREKVSQAIISDQAFELLREFIFDYYYAEDEYLFETEELETLFAALATYLEFEEAYGDNQKAIRLFRLSKVLQKKDWTIEQVIYALEYDRLGRIMSAFQAHFISQEDLQTQVTKLFPLAFDVSKMIKLYNDSQIVSKRDDLVSSQVA